MHIKTPFSFLLALALVYGCSSDPYSGPYDTPDDPKEQTDPKEEEPEPEPDGAFESAADAVIHMGAGWNLGNTLDSHSGSKEHMWIEAWTSRTPKDYETAWGQPQATRELMHMFKEAGFGAIRIPVTWYPHMGEVKVDVIDGEAYWDTSTWTGTDVDPVWMARVKEVVDYVMDEGMYCILNVHHDTGDNGSDYKGTAWLVADRFDDAKARYAALWGQIAETFKDYGPRLLFESYNEMLDSYNSWCFASFASPARYDESVAAAAYSGINSYAKLFVDTVRATGGNNAERNLVVNTYGACSGDGTWNQHLKDPLINMQIPEAPGHIAVQVHSYWDSEKFSASQKKEIDQLFTNLDTHIIQRLGVPVIIGEWGGNSPGDTRINAEFSGYFTSKARQAGVATFMWMGLSDGEDRAVPAWSMPLAKAAIISSYQ
ncbi:MAG: glycoside hydrolase family 5 protein [Bacteroidales bacterium]|nr:glycoside hydrolase family 5 protein [Bacteroidales bacterium]